MLEKTTKHDEIKELKNTTEKHEKTVLKPLKFHNEYYEKKYKRLYQKKVLLNITEILLGGASTITTSTLSVVNPSICIIFSCSTALLTSIAILVKKEYISKLKIRYINIREWIIVNTLL